MASVPAGILGAASASAVVSCRRPCDLVSAMQCHALAVRYRAWNGTVLVMASHAVNVSCLGGMKLAVLPSLQGQQHVHHLHHLIRTQRPGVVCIWDSPNEGRDGVPERVRPHRRQLCRVRRLPRPAAALLPAPPIFECVVLIERYSISLT